MSSETEIRPFLVEFPAEEIADLRRRIAATRWPERETVTDDSQGVRLALVQGLARYWGTDYDWRTGEKKLNAQPNFITEIDGLGIYFIHVRSRHEDALPLIVTHRWPGAGWDPPRTARAARHSLQHARYRSAQPHPRPQARPRRPLHRVGTAGPVQRADARLLPDSALARLTTCVLTRRT
jgi:hypothetical protein